MNFCQGTNWESAAYEVHRFSTEDEVTALDVSDRHIAVQYHAEPIIDVFDRDSKERLFRLEGRKQLSWCSMSVLLCDQPFGSKITFFVDFGCPLTASLASVL